jgi:hypothetical protein
MSFTPHPTYLTRDLTRETGPSSTVKSGEYLQTTGPNCHGFGMVGLPVKDMYLEGTSLILLVAKK